MPITFLTVTNLLIYRRVSLNQKSRVRRKSAATVSAGNLAYILIVIGRDMHTFISQSILLPSSGFSHLQHTQAFA